MHRLGLKAIFCWVTHSAAAQIVGLCCDREQAKGATFFSAVEGETVRPIINVCWAPMLGAFSVLFEEFHDNKARCLVTNSSYQLPTRRSICEAWT